MYFVFIIERSLVDCTPYTCICQTSFASNQTSPFSHSDGSTETVSVMDIDDGPTEKGSDSAVATLSLTSDVQQSQSTSPLREHSSIYSEHETEPDSGELDPQYRSLSMDSAYGTLSPESLLRELQSRPSQSEGEETEEEEGERESQEMEREEEQDEEEEEEEDSTSLGSQLSVVQSCKPRRRPHVQGRLHLLQRPLTLVLSRSEDNLLQRLHHKTLLSHKHSLNNATQDQSQSTEKGTVTSLPHSKSLSELGRNCTGLFTKDLSQSDDFLSAKMPCKKLSATLKRAEARQVQRTQAGPCRGDELRSLGGGTAPSACHNRNCESAETSPKTRKSPAQQHKKLTVAQLYRIRTTLVLNSTLTAS